jgi:hypothetical protein
MSREIIKYVFVYDNKKYVYEQSIKLNNYVDRYSSYKYLNSIAIYGLNLFLRDTQINNDFKFDFTVIYKNFRYSMHAERNEMSNENYKFMLEPIISVIKNGIFSYDNVMFINSPRSNTLTFDDEITDLKIIDDGITKFDESQINILDNLPYTIENLYLFYNLKNPIRNLPHTIKNIYVYENSDTDLIKIPYECTVNFI